MVSWYVENGCINVDRLAPFWFATLMVVLQFIWAMIMFASGPSTNIIFKFGKGCLQIFTILSFIAVAIMDIIDCIQWISKNPETSSWDHYLCMGAILFASSNWKTLITTYLTLIIVPSLDADMSSLMDIFKIYDWTSLQKTTLIVMLLWVIFLSFGGWLVVIWIPSLVVIGWPILLLICCLGLSACYCEDKGNEKWTAFFSVIGFGVLPLFAITASLFLPLGAINIYSGLDYEYGFEPFIERDWDSYWYHIEEAYVDPVVRFISWLL
eukprot:528731_1